MSVRVCRPKLFKNFCLSLVSGVPPLLFRTTPLADTDLLLISGADDAGEWQDGLGRRVGRQPAVRAARSIRRQTFVHRRLRRRHVHAPRRAPPLPALPRRHRPRLVRATFVPLRRRRGRTSSGVTRGDGAEGDSCPSAVVKLLGKRWWIPVGERLEGPKLEPEGPKAEVGFPTAD